MRLSVAGLKKINYTNCHLLMEIATFVLIEMINT